MDVGALTFEEALRPLTEVIMRLRNSYDEIARDHGMAPTAKSQAMADLNNEKQFATEFVSNPASNARSMILLSAMAGFDHLIAYAHLINAPITPVYAHLVVARAGILSFGTAAWLADPGVTTETRFKRTFAYEGLDAVNRKRYGIQDVKDTGTRILSETRSSCRELGWRAILNEREQNVGGEKIPSGREFIELVVTGSDPLGEGRSLAATLWAYLSGASHGSVLALMQSVEGGSAEPGYDEMVRARVVTTASSVVLMGLGIVTAAFTSAAQVVQLMGWKSESWAATAVEVHRWSHGERDRLQRTPNARNM